MRHDKILLPMGAGGLLSQELMEDVFLPGYGNETLRRMDDAAELNVGNTRLAFTTDSFTVKPIFFPGGDIGKLAVCGTLNDLAVKGAKPLALSAGFIIEEGFPVKSLKQIVSSMREAAAGAGVSIVTGDTKVVGRGEADGIYINTSGIGVVCAGLDISCARAQVGDSVIISGTLADHGIAVMNAREKLGFTPEIESDVACVWKIVEKISVFGAHIHAMRDPTRGGLASVLNEIARASRVNIKIYEALLPVKEQVLSCCDLLGLDPLYLANEGKAVIIADRSVAGPMLRMLRQLPIGQDAQLIAEVDGSEYSPEVPPVFLENAIGTKRFVPMIEGDPLPRIC